MVRKSGRPPRAEGDAAQNRQLIIDTAARLIREKGTAALTVRSVCAAADIGTGTFYYHFRDKNDLLMSFISGPFYGSEALKTPVGQIADRIVELYMRLVGRYMELGLGFMKSFYTTDNQSLSAYMSERDGAFEPDTVMAQSEEELRAAREAGVVRADADVHLIGRDLCTIVKGCVFEWCLTGGTIDAEAVLRRIIRAYMQTYLAG